MLYAYRSCATVCLIIFSSINSTNGFFGFSITSTEKQEAAERNILQRVSGSLNLSFVNISFGRIRALIARNFRSKQAYTNMILEKHIPIVLVHGFAAGIGLWCKNLDSLATSRRVYAFDLPGFGRSARHKLPESPIQILSVWVESIKEFTEKMNLTKFILVGHSLGGYLATAYAIKFPIGIAHLVLVDPWGFTNSIKRSDTFFGRIKQKFTGFDSLKYVRFAGYLGERLLTKMRPDLGIVYRQFPKGYNASEGDVTDEASPFHSSKIYRYVFQMNVQEPSGEMAFLRLGDKLGNAKILMLPKVVQIRQAIPITFIYGSDSWISSSDGIETQKKRSRSFVDVKVIMGAGHQAYAEAAKTFNGFINEIAEKVDRES